jgi:hypothetical protein
VRARLRLAAVLAEPGERLGITLALHDGPQDAHAGHPRAVADHFRQRDVHLRQRLLDQLQMSPSVLD